MRGCKKEKSRQATCRLVSLTLVVKFRDVGADDPLKNFDDFTFFGVPFKTLLGKDEVVIDDDFKHTPAAGD